MLNQTLKKFAIVLAIPFAFITSSCSNNTVRTLITKVRSPSNPTFGNIDFEVSTKDFIKAGFNYDDLIDVKIKDYDGKGTDAVLHTAFVKSFNETGYFAPCLCNYEGTKEYFELSFAINPLKNISKTFVGKDVEFTMVKKKGYKKRRELVNVSQKLTYQELGGDNASFANFRDVAISGAVYTKVEPQRLYRGSSPFNSKDNPNGRHHIADELMKFYNIDNEISLSCTLDEVGSYMEKIDKSETNKKWNESYEWNPSKGWEKKGNLEDMSFYSVNLGTDFFNLEGEEGTDAKAVQEVFNYMYERINNKQGEEAPKFYFHCNEGKDRTAFFIMLLEALSNVPIKDIVLDYMMTFKNYYNVSVINNEEKYKTLAELGIYRYVYSILVDDPLVDLQNIDWYSFDVTKAVNEMIEINPDALHDGAEKYMRDIVKFSDDKIDVIENWLKTQEKN